MCIVNVCGPIYHNSCSIAAEVSSLPYHKMKSFRLRISTAKRQLQKKRRILAVETFCRSFLVLDDDSCIDYAGAGL